MISYCDAVDEMFAYATQVWSDASSGVLQTKAELRYQGVEADHLPDVSQFWGRVASNVVVQEGAGVGQLDNSGAKRYRTQGFLTVEVFCPKTVEGSFFKGRSLAQQLRYGFLGSVTPNRVVFNNAKIDDSGFTNEQWLKLIVYVDFEFDEIV